uniref:C-type lectin domain-containing protein n=1 Tax=Sinocyclocheilus grahami TaxID=75366 RepID=A0A672QBB4_SINGR
MSNILVNVEGWTYHWMDNETMTWSETREWCQKHYTDIVMKNLHLPNYWIGMRKINGAWTWVANGQSVNYEYWAPDEPNNNKSDENCVELYISRINNNGKWNNDSCKNPKHPVCHKTQCPNKCTDRQDCEEQVNNFPCVCKPVISCEPLSAPPHAELKYNSSGAWNAPPPSCAAECFPILLFGGGLMNCTEGHDSIRSACRVQCPPAHLLLGFAEFTCRADGTWESLLFLKYSGNNTYIYCYYH